MDEESIEMAISRIYGTLRYSRPDAPGIADLDPTQQTVMHALIAQGRRHRGARLARCCRRTQTLGFA